MNDIQTGGTIKERLARLEVMMCNHLDHHDKRDKWMMRILATLTGGFLLMILPGFIKWVASIL